MIIVGSEPVNVKLHVAPEPPPPVIVKNCGAFIAEYLPPLMIVIDVTLPPALELPPPLPPPPSCWIYGPTAVLVVDAVALSRTMPPLLRPADWQMDDVTDGNTVLEILNPPGFE
jgi:hypothetical protein